MNIKNRILYAVLLLIFSGGLLSGCSKEEAKASQAAPPPPTVTISNPVEKDIIEYADFTGNTEAVESVTIRARVEGTLEKLYFKPGQIVKKGALLYTIDPAPYRARLEEAKAQLLIHEAELKLAEATSKRREQAFKNKAVSEVEVIEANSKLTSAMAGVAAAKAAIKRASIDLSYTKIKAPISGRIGRSLVDPGNLVGAGQRTELTTIVNDEKIYAYFNISERELLLYQKLNGQNSPAMEGTPVFLGLAGKKDFPFKGKIDYVHNRVNQLTGTIGVRAVFSNKNRMLMAGLFARVQIPVGQQKKELLVPNSALGRDQQGYFLLIADKENKVRHQPVEAGILSDGLRVISMGIKKEDKVIINGLQKAFPGALVNPVEKNIASADEVKSKA